MVRQCNYTGNLRLLDGRLGQAPNRYDNGPKVGSLQSGIYKIPVYDLPLII